MIGTKEGRKEGRKFDGNFESGQITIYRNYHSISLAANVLIKKFLINDSFKSNKNSLTSIL